MDNDIPSFQSGDSLGNYILEERVSKEGSHEVWQARQTSVNRIVETELFMGADREAFLENVRVKAAVDDGVMGSVYEAIIDDHVVGFAREQLTGTTLEDLVNQQQELLPSQVNQVILQVSKSLQGLDDKNLGYGDFTGSDIWIDGQNSVRMTNVAQASQADDPLQSRKSFVDALLKVLKTGEPGATRMQTLLQYIVGTTNEAPISWEKTVRYAEQVTVQLASTDLTDGSQAPTESIEPKRNTPVMLVGGVFAVLIVAVGFYFIENSGKEVASELITTIPQGQYRNPSGKLVSLNSFRMDRQEVTIGEYSDFLDAFQIFSDKEKAALKPPGIPSDKNKFRPDDWLELLHAAREESMWEGRKVTLDCPVVGVDWWDASTYARWKGGRLPRINEWWAAMQFSDQSDETQDWGPVGGTGFGPHGLNGNVSEWLDESLINPAFPMNSPQPVIVGGSFQKRGSGARTREWLKSRMLRRTDVGFRVVYQ